MKSLLSKPIKEVINKCWVMIVLVIFLNVMSVAIIFMNLSDHNEVQLPLLLALIGSIHAPTVIGAFTYITGHNIIKMKYPPKAEKK